MIRLTFSSTEAIAATSVTCGDRGPRGPRPPRLHVHAAVDVKGVTGDVRRFVPQQNSTADATSAGVPSLFIGTRSRSRFFASSESDRVIAVSMNPGATQLTVMFREASSRASVRERPSIPAFAAA